MNNINTVVDWSITEHRNKVFDFLYNLDKKSYRFTVKPYRKQPYRKQRSVEANAYYWSTIIPPICELYGRNPKDESDRNFIHEMLKKKFNSVEVSFNRTMFAFDLGNGLEENKRVIDYLEKINYKPKIYGENKKVLLPLYVVEKIEERFDYGENIEIEETETLPLSTTANDTLEFYEYIENIRNHYAIEHNLYIPNPKK
tara:strand:+ start:1167 stop:1763 length:597 start_codon:yes stop_codon:yes gene_type:complete